MRVTSSRLIGREAEFAELEAAFADAAAGRPRLIIVAGESGVGKTRLLSAVRAHAADFGARALSGDCLQVSQGELPYAPLVAALRPLVRERHPVLAKLGPAHRAELGRLLPGIDTGTGSASTPADGSTQIRLFEVLLELLDCLARDTPALLALEDVHWADRSTRAFIGFLAQSLTAERVLALITYRTDELHRRHPLRALLADLDHDEHVARLTLAPFDRDQVAQAVEDILGRAPDTTLLDRLYARSEGNPLYLEELIAAGADGRGRAPSSLQDALMVRIERLSPHARDVLRVLSVGEQLDHALLARVSGLDASALRDALREVVASHLVVVNEERQYVFRHALQREVVWDDLLPGERIEAHRALADALLEVEARGDGTPQTGAAIAHHLYSAGDRPAALAASVRAADSAGRAHAYAEAAALLERALELWERTPDPGAILGMDHVELLAHAAEAHHRGGARDRQEGLLRAALSEVDASAEPLRAGRLMERLAVCQRNLNHTRAALVTAFAGLTIVGDAPSSERAALLTSVARSRMLEGRWRDGAQAAREALALARAVGNRDAETGALDALGVFLIAAGDTAEGMARSREAIDLARADDRPDAFCTAYLNLADALHLRGEVREAWRVAEEGLSILPRGRVNFWLHLLIAELAIDTGDWSRAEENLPPPDRRRVGNELLNANIRRAELALGRGDHDRARALLDELVGDIARTAEPQYIAPYGALRAELFRRQGDLAAARAVVDETLGRIEFCTDDVARVARIAAVGIDVDADLAQRCRDLGESANERLTLERVSDLLTRLRTAARLGGPVEQAWRTHGEAQATRARANPDVNGWREAAGRWEQLSRPYLAAQAHLREAEALLGREDRRAATAALRDARRQCERIGARWLLSEIDGVAVRARLVLSGAEVAPEPRPDDPFGLTERERQVLTRLARGMTNREIGTELFMAEKTASVHVSRILGKLGVRTRTEAAAVAYRHGLHRSPAP